MNINQMIACMYVSNLRLEDSFYMNRRSLHEWKVCDYESMNTLQFNTTYYICIANNMMNCLYDKEKERYIQNKTPFLYKEAQALLRKSFI